MRRIRLVTAITCRQSRMTVQRMNPHAELDDLYRARTPTPLRSASTYSAIRSHAGTPSRITLSDWGWSAASGQVSADMRTQASVSIVVHAVRERPFCLSRWYLPASAGTHRRTRAGHAGLCGRISQRFCHPSAQQ